MVDINKLLTKINNKKREFVKNEKPATPKLGINKIVLLPGWRKDEPELFWREFGAHYIKDPATGKCSAYYPCDSVIYGKDCPVCLALAQASRMTNDPATLEVIKQARAGTQFLVNAIVIGENNNMPVVFALSKTAFEQLMNVISSWGNAVFDDTNPQVIQIDRSGTGFDTRYMVTVTPEKFPLSKNVIENMKNLDDYVNQRSEQLAKKATAAISGIAGAPIAMVPYSEVESKPAQIAAQPQTQSQPQSQAPWASADIPSAGSAASTAYAPQPAQPVPPKASASVPIDAEMDELLEGLDGL